MDRETLEKLRTHRIHVGIGAPMKRPREKDVYCPACSSYGFNAIIQFKTVQCVKCLENLIELEPRFPYPINSFGQKTTR